MVFTITNFNKQLDTYQVMSDAGQVMSVHGIQIVQVMLQGYIFNNAYLTKKGFGIQTDTGVRYIQVPMNKQIMKTVAEFIALRDKKEAEMKAQMQVQNKPRATAKVKSNTSCLGNRQKIGGTNNQNRIVYKGQPFSSPEKLCAKFGRDVNTFLSLRAKGYTMDEALGLMPLRPEGQLQPRYNVNKALDSLDSARGEY